MHERDRIIILFSFYSCYFYCSTITTLHFNNYEKKKRIELFCITLIDMRNLRIINGSK